VKRAVLAAKAALAVGVAKVLLRRRPTTEVLCLLAGTAGPTSAGPTSAPGVTKTVEVNPQQALRAVRASARFFRAGCLEQSVALAALLQRANEQPSLVIGCRRYGGSEWGAHAWVELDGTRLEPAMDAHHTPIARLTAAGGWKLSPG
jgi:hypothetical protein